MARRTCFVLLLVALSAPSFSEPAAQSQLVVATATPSVTLARIVMPLETFAETERQSARANFLRFAGSSADLRRMERDFPGAKHYIWKALEAEWRRGSKQAHIGLISDMARIYAAGLNPEEVAAATTFYQSPTGQKALKTFYGGADHAASATKIVASRAVTIDAQSAGYLESARQVAHHMTPADQQVLSAFTRAVEPAKLLTIFRQVQESVRLRANDSNSPRHGRLNAISYRASKEWVTRAQKKR